MKKRLYTRLDKFYRKTMKNYSRKILEDEAASTELSFNETVEPLDTLNKSELVTSIHELEGPNQLKLEKPSYRILIKTISINDMD